MTKSEMDKLREKLALECAERVDYSDHTLSHYSKVVNGFRDGWDAHAKLSQKPDESAPSHSHNRHESAISHEDVMGLITALEFYSGVGDKERVIEWRPHVCDSWTGQGYDPDWNGSLQTEPGEIAIKALATFKSKYGSGE